MKMRSAEQEREQQPLIITILASCAWCNKIKVGSQGENGKWLEGDHRQYASSELVSHGICPECKKSVLSQMKLARVS